jgi:aspartate racemase
MATKNPGRKLTGYHRAALRRLEASGAEFALMASTPHHRYASIVRGIGIPVPNIFEVVAKESARSWPRRL